MYICVLLFRIFIILAYSHCICHRIQLSLYAFCFLLFQYVSDLDEILDIKCTDRFVVTATNSEQIKLFDHEEGNCVVLTGHSDTVMSIDVSIDGRTLVSGAKVYYN